MLALPTETAPATVFRTSESMTGADRAHVVHNLATYELYSELLQDAIYKLVGVIEVTARGLRSTPGTQPG